MKKIVKIIAWTVASAIVLLVLAGSLFVYKVKYGFPVSYETEPPEITVPSGRKSVLLFSKATGFRHGESIEAGKTVFGDLAEKKGWFLYPTEEGGVFNETQLPQFDVVVFNNCTGRLLNDQQRLVLQGYVEDGGRLLGIHGAGDDSHRWDWYNDNLLGALFSHHPMNPQLQQTVVSLDNPADSALIDGLPQRWDHTDEWYIFFENPRDQGFEVVFTIDGDQVDPDGNILWMKDKNFGMGPDHPVAWYRQVGNGWTFYTSMGHHGQVWQEEIFVKMLTNFIEFDPK